MGHQEGSCVAWKVKGGVLSTSFLVFLCFHIKSPAVSAGCSLLSFGEGRREEQSLMNLCLGRKPGGCCWSLRIGSCSWFCQAGHQAATSPWLPEPGHR